jgi:phosphonoacetate hydrolase
MTRRRLLRLTAASFGASGVLLPGPRPQQRRKVLFACIDGLDPRYLGQSDVPNLRRLMREGAYDEGHSVIPSVTNVNNSSIATGSFPEEHGITTNYFFDRKTRQGTFMETADFLLRPTLFVKAREQGWKTAIVSAKHKIYRLIGQEADYKASGQEPSPDIIERAGPRQDMYTPDVNYWCARGAHSLLGDGYDLVYLATTDYMMHTYPPEDERSRTHMEELDGWFGRMVNDFPGIEIYLSADHGMNAKTQGVDIGRLLAEKGIEAEAVPIIRDRHVVHHKNLGGACYVYLMNPQDEDAAFELLRETEGVEELYRRAEAARKFRLYEERIGDLFLLGEKHVAFGALDRVREDIAIRSHGSRHESVAPILRYGAGGTRKHVYNLDLTRYFDWTA